MEDGDLRAVICRLGSAERRQQTMRTKDEIREEVWARLDPYRNKEKQLDSSLPELAIHCGGPENHATRCAGGSCLRTPPAERGPRSEQIAWPRLSQRHAR